MYESFKKALKIAKKTNSAVIMFNPEKADESFALIDLDSYEKLLSGDKIKENENLTEDNLADKINREISLWKNQENPEIVDSEESPKKRWQIPPQVKNKAKEVE